MHCRSGWKPKSISNNLYTIFFLQLWCHFTFNCMAWLSKIKEFRAKNSNETGSKWGLWGGGIAVETPHHILKIPIISNEIVSFFEDLHRQFHFSIFLQFSHSNSLGIHLCGSRFCGSPWGYLYLPKIQEPSEGGVIFGGDLYILGGGVNLIYTCPHFF